MAYERCIRLAVSILVCNYAGLNQAIEMRLDQDKLNAPEQI